MSRRDILLVHRINRILLVYGMSDVKILYEIDCSDEDDEEGIQQTMKTIDTFCLGNYTKD